MGSNHWQKRSSGWRRSGKEGFRLIGLGCLALVVGCQGRAGTEARCGDGVCDPPESVTTCREDCESICGNGLAEPDNDEECDGEDLEGLTCLDLGYWDGILSCGENCELDTTRCTEVEGGCGNGIVESGEECDDGNTIDGDGCSSICFCEAECGNGIVECREECDGGEGCSEDCTLVACQHAPWEECDPGGQDQCCPDAWGIASTCVDDVFTTPLCTFECAQTSDCHYTEFCYESFGICVGSYCGSSQFAFLGGEVNAPCQVPGGGEGWCVPFDTASMETGICVGEGLALHGQPCDQAELPRSVSPLPNQCERGVCLLTGTCAQVCDWQGVYDTRVDPCPEGFNCLGQSFLTEVEPNVFVRSADLAYCVATLETDPANGLSACDLVTGELTAGTDLTCADVGLGYACALAVFPLSLGWGQLQGTCALVTGAPTLTLWDECDPNSVTDICPETSLCVADNLVSGDGTGVTRCVPFCDTQETLSCQEVHPELPAEAVCLTVANWYAPGYHPGTTLDEAPSRLGLCGCPVGGCAP